MAEEQIIISVDLDAGQAKQRLDEVTGEIIRLKDQQKQLTQSFKDGEITAVEYANKQKALSQEVSALTRQQSNLTSAVKLTTQASDDYADSLDGQRQKLGDMQRAYASLTKEQRESAKGQEFLAAIKAQSDAVKEMEAAMGDSRRNVGNYAGAILEASGKMGGFGKATAGVINPIKGATNGLKAMAATPIIAILNILVTIIVKLADKFKQNGAAMESLTKVFGLFEGAGVLVNKVIDGIAQGVTWLADKLYDLADKFGLISDTAKKTTDLSREQLAIQKAENELIKTAADRELQISELRAKTAEKNKYTAQERLKFLQQAIDLEKKQSQDEYELAKRKYEAKKAENELSASSVEDIREENQLYAAMVKAQTDHQNKLREYNAQITEAQNQMKAQTKDTGETIVETEESVAAKIQELRKKYGLISNQEEYARELSVLKDSYAKKLLTEEEYLKAEAKLRADYGIKTDAEMEEERAKKIRAIREQYGLVTDAEKYAEELAQLQSFKEQQLLTEEEYLEALKGLQSEYGVNADDEDKSVDEIVKEMFGIDAEAMEHYNNLLQSGMDKQTAFEQTSQFVAKRSAKAFADAAGTMAGTFNQMADFLGKYAKENEGAAKAQKAFALAGILASQAQSIANGAQAISAGVASAAAVPFPGNIASIATIVAQIVALITSTATSFAQAKQLLSGDNEAGKFANGGIVGGTSYTGDKMRASVNSREMILTTEQQRNLFEIANTPSIASGIDYGALAAAMAAQPAPVMVYEEFKSFEQRTANINELATL